MNIISLLPLLAALAYIPLVVISLTTRPWHKHHLIFIIFLLAGMLWSLSTFFMRSDYLMEQKLLLFKMTTISYFLFIVQFYFFIKYFLHKRAGPGVYFGFALLGVVTIGSILGYIPESLTIERGTVSPKLGLWFYPIMLALYGLASHAIYMLIKRFKSSSDPIERNRIIYLFCAVILLFLFGIINTTSLGARLPAAQIGHFLNAALLTYATLKFKILDMNQIVRRSFIYAAMLIVCLAVFVAWTAIVQFTFHTAFNYFALLGTGVLTGLTVSFFWVKLHNFLARKIDLLFYGESYDYRQKLVNFVRRDITHVFSLEELCKSFLPILTRIMACKNSYMLFPEPGSNDFAAKYVDPGRFLEHPFIIKHEGPITKWLLRENRYLNISNIDIAPEFRSLWKNEKDLLKELDIELLFPLISRNNLVGILACSRKESGKYNLDETNLIENVSGQIAISVEKEFIQAELRRSEQELSLINRLAGVMTSSLNINEVYDAFASGLREVIDVDFATVAIIEENDLLISAVYSEVGTIWHAGEKLALKGSATEWVIRHKKDLYEPDLEQDRMFYTGEEYLKRGIHSIVYLPLITKGEGLGCLTVATRHSHAYNPGQLQLLERLASQISTSVANAQLFAHAEQRARIDELTGLFNRRHFDEILKQEVSRHSRYGSLISIAFMDLDNFKTYNDSLGHPVGDKLLAHIGRIIRSSLRNIDMAFRYGGDEFAVIMPHTSAEDAFGVAERIRVRVSDQTYNPASLITTSIGIASWPNDGLSPDDLVNAADKALYYTKQTGGNRTCMVSQMLPSAQTDHLDSVPPAEKETLNTIYALSATIEARDPYTYGHSKKVRAYSVALAEAIGFPSEKVAAVSHAALLHDIGKIGVIDEILKKKGKLDNQEQQAIKTHPLLSKTIVGHVSSLTPCLPAILHHHEHFDGSGYPSGLKGEAIPLEARVLSIADAFDAMTSLRPYRSPLTFKEAINELKRCAGTQFDPLLVEKFIPICLTISFEEMDIREKPALEK
ncbi:MAG TPA: diguanylate cyclase [Dehalococcoidia bacterium]|nr:diguanylate cyclase [Dehalococcoidia bacterium]